MRFVRMFMVMAIFGCSTQVVVAPFNPGDDGEIKGIPFRVMAAHTIRVYKMNPISGRYEQVHRKSVNLPLGDELYTLNYNASFVANPQFEVAFNSDNTIKMLQVEGESSVDKVISSVGTQAAAAANAALEFDNMKRAAKQGKLASEGNLLSAESTVLTNQLNLMKSQSTLTEFPGTQTSNQEANLEAALKARQNVEAAEREVSVASQEDLPNVIAKLQLLRLQANHAYRRAGLTEPYPGVFP